MQPGHEEVALTLVPDLEVLPAELLDDSNTSAQEMRVRLKRNMENMMSICLTRFPISGLWGPLYIPIFRVIHKNSGFYVEGI